MMSCPKVRMAGPIRMRVLMMVRNLANSSETSGALKVARNDQLALSSEQNQEQEPLDAVDHPKQSEDSQDEDNVQNLAAAVAFRCSHTNTNEHHGDR